MKKTSSHLTSGRAVLGAFLLICGLGLLCTVALVDIFATPTPSMGTVGPSPGGPSATWRQGSPTTPGGNANMESSCVENVTCETFTVTVSGTQSNWAGQRVQVQLNWQSSANEYDIYIHQGVNTNTSGTGANSGALVTSAMNGPGLTNQTAFIDVAQWGTGTFTVHAVYDTTPVATDAYQGTATAVPETPAPPPPAPKDTGPKIGYENFEAPGVLTQGTATSSGAFTVEYMGRGAGEPSIGVDWNSTSNSVGGMTNFQSDLETLFVSWNESCSPTIPKATWVNRRAPTSLFIDSDPIGFTDRQTGRVFAAELTLLSPTCKTSYTDNDGITWVPSQGSGLASAVDHETIGGGPYHSPLNLNPPSPVYPHAVYYCSQDIAAAFCSRSDDGGLTFGPSIPIYNLTACGGLHGHVKVAPDGTVYVPNRGCGADAAVVVSEDNGTTWAVRQVQNSSVTNTATTDDPAVGIDNNGTVYFLGAMNGTAAMVATSTNKGQTWSNIYNVGAAYGVNNVAFPAAVAGDAGRAAVAFYGATGGVGDSNADGFTGVWHLYVAHTFDGGAHWTTSDATPTLPMQRMGLLRGGGGPMDRNLLDFFDITIDRDGRVQVGYVNGCSGGPCAQAPTNADGSTGVSGNAYTATASIARQSSGRRMIAAKDPAKSTSVPGMPFVTETRIGNVVRLAWNEADTGNSPILKYQILRGTASNSEVLLTTVPGTQTSYTDNTATDATQTYYYKVAATNAIGSSCANNEIAAPFVGDTCAGVVIHRNLPTHPESTGGTVTQPPLPQYLIDYIAVGEPPSTNELMFKMKVGALTPVPPNSRWRMVWNSVETPDEQFYVGMTSDANSNVTFEYGTVATASLVVLGVPTENPLGAADAGSNFNADGTITIYIDKSKVGSPQPGDLLGAVNGRTFNTGDTPPETLERSNLLIDHTFVKGNTDNSYPPATYTVVGNTICSSGNIEPVDAVSQKKQGKAGTFAVDLPLTGKPGIEDRSGGNGGNYQVAATFTVPVKVKQVTVTPGAGGTASVSSFGVRNTQVTVNLTTVSDAQTLTINLIGVSGGTRSGNVAIPMSVLIGDTNADGVVNATDVSQTQAQSGKSVTQSNFREDVNADGAINSADVALVQSESGTALH
ncbi:MAG TPA: dockerin type I domain-containing protein [Candidatus Udaeobacter sp.]